MMLAMVEASLHDYLMMVVAFVITFPWWSLAIAFVLLWLLAVAFNAATRRKPTQREKDWNR
jgi:hypothetical protein